MNPINTGFSNYSQPLSMYSKGTYDDLVGIYSDFTNKAHDFKKMLSKKYEDLAKLKKKYHQTKSQQLAELIQKKENTLGMLNKTLEEARDGYFSEGDTMAQQVKVYMDMALANV